MRIRLQLFIGVRFFCFLPAYLHVKIKIVAKVKISTFLNISFFTLTYCASLLYERFSCELKMCSHFRGSGSELIFFIVIVIKMLFFYSWYAIWKGKEFGFETNDHGSEGMLNRIIVSFV